EDQDIRVRRQASPRYTERHVRRLPTLGPEIRAGGALTELESSIDDAELRVDLEGARLHAERSCLLRRPGMSVDDERRDTAPGELIGKHEPRRPRADDQDFGVHPSSVTLRQSMAHKSIRPARRGQPARGAALAEGARSSCWLNGLLEFEPRRPIARRGTIRMINDALL